MEKFARCPTVGLFVSCFMFPDAGTPGSGSPKGAWPYLESSRRCDAQHFERRGAETGGNMVFEALQVLIGGVQSGYLMSIVEVSD